MYVEVERIKTLVLEGAEKLAARNPSFRIGVEPIDGIAKAMRKACLRDSLNRRYDFGYRLVGMNDEFVILEKASGT